MIATSSNVRVRVQGLSKTYSVRDGGQGILGGLLNPRHRTVTALLDVDLTVKANECLGFIGPNGAGKSTLVKILTGLQRPTAGRVEVLGEIPHRRSRSFLKQIGVVFGHKTSLWWDLPLRESFRDSRVIYSIPVERYRQNLDLLLVTLNLGHLLDRPVRQLSLGERVKSELALALLHQPKLLVLDEPTVGLDLESKSDLRSLIRQWVTERGASVFLTSHDMGDIGHCCDRVILVSQGVVKHVSTMTELRALLDVGDHDTTGLEQQLIQRFKIWRGRDALVS
jgi:ABC-2 type transport system ATP-binding protein